MIKQISALGMAVSMVLVTNGAMAETKLDTDDAKFSYSIGIGIAKNAIRSLNEQGIKFENAAVLQGMSDVLSNKSLQMTEDEMVAIQQKVIAESKKQQAAAQEKLGADNLAAGSAYLAKNAKEDGVITTDSGLQYKVVTKGKGKKPAASDTVSVHYEGRLINGTVFDSSYQRGEPISFPVGGVIQGWQEALQLMPVGSKWQLVIPANLAYGPNGPGAIGPNSTLIFDVELLSIK